MSQLSIGDPPEAPSRRRLFLCLVVGLAAGLAWGVLGAVSGTRLTWAAPLVGLAVGLVVRDVSGAGASRRRWAVGLALLALLMGRSTLQAVGARYVSPREARLDTALVSDAVAARLREDPGLADRVASGGADGRPLVGPALLRAMDLATHDALSELDGSGRRALAQWYVRTADVAVVRPHRPTWRLTLWEFAAWTAALAAAAAINPGAAPAGEDEEDDEEPEVDDGRA